MANYSDNMTRADAPTLGSDYTVATDTGLQIVSNTARLLDSTSCGVLLTGVTQANDQRASITMLEQGPSNYYTVYLRASGSGGTLSGYQLSFGGDDEWYLEKLTSASSATLDSGTFDQLDTNDVLTGEAEGTTIRILRNSELIASVVDTTYSSGLTGFAMFGNIAVNPPGVSLFEAQDIGGGGGGGIGRGRLIGGKLVGGILIARRL
jgi:hypothetical protein